MRFNRPLGRPFARLSAVLAAALGLAACGPISGLNPFGQDSLRAPTTPVTGQPLGASAGQIAGQLGSGPVKVGLILPLTQGGGPSAVGASLRNSAELAIADVGGNAVTVLVEDDQSSPDGARQAAQAAIDGGAEILLGPLFAPDVREVSKVARGAGRPVIGFSTDAGSASRGTYLLSFLIETYVDRIVDFAASKGKRSIGALIPDSDYGRVAESEFQQVAARRNIRVAAVEHYQPGTLAAAVKNIAAGSAQMDALFIPDQADGMVAVSQALTGAGLDSRKIQILGTGVWNDARVLKLPALQGAWFAAPESAGFNAFAGRYRAKYGSEPVRIATLSYDAVSLVAALAKMPPGQRYAEGTLTNPSGFNGADGVFRFRADGTNDRGLAILQISNGAATTISPAPRSFSGAPSG